MVEKQLVKLGEVEGFQHAQDDYWFRPLLFGKGLFMYVAHVPPGGDMPANGHAEKEEFEVALYMLEGSLEITYGEEKFEIDPEMALLVPLGTPFGVKNSGRETASFVLTFSPPPEIESREELRKRFEARGGVVKSPEEMNELRGRVSLKEEG